MITNPIEALEDVKNYIKCLSTENKDLQQRINVMQDDKYKDKELAKMKTTLNRMKEDYTRGFPITKEQEEKIDEWIEKHRQKYHSCNYLRKWDGCSIIYLFEPTHEKCFGAVECTTCKNRPFLESDVWHFDFN